MDFEPMQNPREWKKAVFSDSFWTMVQNAKNHTKSAITFEIIGFFKFSTTIDLRIKLPTQIISHIEHLTNLNFFKISPKDPQNRFDIEY